MNFEGRITIGRTTSNHGPDTIRVTIEDKDAAVQFAEATLTLEQYALLITGLACVPCEVEAGGLEHVGKKMEHRVHEFPLLTEPSYRDNEAAVKRRAVETCPEGWVPDLYFGVQGSYFVKDGKPWARCTIRRWVEKDEARRG